MIFLNIQTISSVRTYNNTQQIMIMLEATYVVNLSVTQIIEIKCDSIFNFDKGRIINALNQDRMIIRYIRTYEMAKHYWIWSCVRSHSEKRGLSCSVVLTPGLFLLTSPGEAESWALEHCTSHIPFIYHILIRKRSHCVLCLVYVLNWRFLARKGAPYFS